jgi:hypothetical protein
LITLQEQRRSPCKVKWKMHNKADQSDGAFCPKRNYSSYGQFIVLDSKVFTDSASSEQLVSVVEEMNQSLLVLYTRFSSDYADGVMSNPEKVMLWEVEPRDNTTSLQTLAGQSLNQLASSFQGSSIGNQKNKPDSSDVLSRVLKKSFVIKWLTYPMSNFMDQDDKARFAEYLVWRDENLADYNKSYLGFVDMIQFLNMLLGYVLDKVERVLSVRLKLKP